MAVVVRDVWIFLQSWYFFVVPGSVGQLDQLVAAEVRPSAIFCSSSAAAALRQA
jgi:hypothetical protein